MKNKFLMILLSLALSFALWSYVVLVVSPESEAVYENIPVVLDGAATLADRDLMIISDTNFRVDLKLSGNRQDLVKLDSSNITLLADLTQITQAGEYDIKYSIFYPGTVQSGTIEVLEKEPQYISIVVVERSQKTVPVRVKYVGNVPDNFIVDTSNLALNHTSITVSGPKSVIDQIDHARIELDLTDKTTDISQDFAYTLRTKQGTLVEDADQVTVNAQEVEVTLKIKQIKEVNLVYDVIDGGGITADMVTVVPQNVNRTWITVSGSQELLAGLDTIHLGTIDLGEQTESGFVTFTVELPEGVDNISGYWEVSYYVEIPVMETREFKVTQFRATNVPKGRYVQIKNEELTVLLRGPVDQLDKIAQGSIVAMVDCLGQSLTDNSNCYLRVTFRITDANGNILENVGAIREDGKDYTVLAYLGLVNQGG